MDTMIYVSQTVYLAPNYAPVATAAASAAAASAAATFAATAAADKTKMCASSLILPEGLPSGSTCYQARK